MTSLFYKRKSSRNCYTVYCFLKCLFQLWVLEGEWACACARPKECNVFPAMRRSLSVSIGHDHSFTVVSFLQSLEIFHIPSSYRAMKCSSQLGRWSQTLQVGIQTLPCTVMFSKLFLVSVPLSSVKWGCVSI